MNESNYKNPFPTTDPDRHYLWEMLVKRDIIAYCNQDWSMVAGDFIEENFMGIDGRGLDNPDSWTISFPDLASYKKEWLAQAADTANTEWAEDHEKAFYEATNLRDIEINGDSALLHKKFNGALRKKDGTVMPINWQTLYRCRKVNGQWKIAGFTGYLPYPMGKTTHPDFVGKRLPAGASQHVTAGPYSPVLQVNPGHIVVISGQAAINHDGNVMGDTIEEQTHFTMKNCITQLEQGGCSINDVFKVNVYLTDLANWPRFNEVYKTYFKDPKPVRTAVQTPLLYSFLVELEMWAVRK